MVQLLGSSLNARHRKDYFQGGRKKPKVNFSWGGQKDFSKGANGGEKLFYQLEAIRKTFFH